MVTTFRLRTTAYAAGLAAVVALAGCSDGGVQAGEPSTQMPAKTSTAVVPSTTSPTTTTPVDPVLARIPAAARPETMEGAAAFSQFYMEQLNEAFMAGNTRPIEGLTRTSCSRCETFRQAIAGLQQKGERHAGESLKVTRRETLAFTKDHRAALVEVELFAVPVVNVSGKRVDMTEADTGAFVATLVFDQHWEVARLQVAQ